MKTNYTIVISGYFNPLHIGHIELIKSARRLGERLFVIVNNDKQVSLKGSVAFMPEDERLSIVSNIIGVDAAFLSIDKDLTVRESLQKINKDYGVDVFANGGDRDKTNIPELDICEKCNIDIKTGIGGEKIQSSSELIKNFGSKL